MPSRALGRVTTAFVPASRARSMLLGCAAALVGCGDSPSGRSTVDGPLVLVVSGDTAGWIVPCGCAANQSGGLPRRATYLAQLEKEHATVAADVGGAPSGTSPYDRVKFEAILQGELAMGVAAHNLGAAEARLGAAYLRDVANRLSVPCVSCNVLDTDGKPVAEPVRVVHRGGRKIAFIGVLSERNTIPGLSISPPRNAILETLAQLNRDEAVDAVVVLAYVPTDELRELAAALPEVDIVVGGPTGQAVPPERVGPTLLASATNKGKFLVRCDWSADHGSWQGQIVEVGGKLSDDPAQQTNLVRFYEELKRRDFTPAETSFVSPLPPDLPKEFAVAGSESCRRCHAEDCQAWTGSKHAAAWSTLVAKGAHVDSYCQQCHTTGFGLPAGYISARRSADRTAVGCESCHGPSAGHVRDPKVHTAYFAKAASFCTTCHDQENSPTFAYDAYWPKIRHGRDALATGK